MKIQHVNMCRIKLSNSVKKIYNPKCFIIKEGKYKISDLSFHLKILEEQNKPTASRRQDVI